VSLLAATLRDWVSFDLLVERYVSEPSALVS
jgi:hypothetical protein